MVVSELGANKPFASNWKEKIDKDFVRQSKIQRKRFIRIFLWSDYMER